ncbi:MAG: hypothetical protein AB7O38_30905 [Pirellulaceae bacterium]
MNVQKKMPEAEVSLRLAFHLIEQGLTASDVHVAIDGAQVKTTDTIHFGISEFLRALKWIKSATDDLWQGTYTHATHIPKVIIHSSPGCGDVVATLIDGRTLRVECKKGPLVRSKSSQEYPLLREALGQLLTMESVGELDLLAVAVPSSPKFQELASRWRQAPLVSRFGIRILTVSRDNQVSGLSEVAAPTKR